MRKAYNYADFAHQFAEHVISEDTSLSLAFVALLHSQNLCAVGDMEKISRHYIDSPLVRTVFLFCSACIQGIPGLSESQIEAQEALDSGLDDWAAMEILTLKLKAGLNERSWGPEEEITFRKMEEIISNNAELECYNPFVQYIEGLRWSSQGSHDEALDRLVSAIELAESFDDLIMSATLRRRIATEVHRIPQPKAMELLMDAKEIYQAHGINTASTLSSLGLILEIRGEFNSALEHYHEAHRKREQAGQPFMSIAYNIARSNLMIGEFDTALEWSKMAAMSASGRRRSYTTLLEGRIQLQLGQQTKASKILEASLEQARKEGSENFLASCYLLQGLLERSKDDYSSALFNLERALDIFTRLDARISTSDCLHNLAETEVMLSSYLAPTDEENQAESWLAQLEHRALEKDFPGYLGLSLLLKAKLLLSKGEIQQAHLLIEEARKYARQPSMAFLKDKIVEVEALSARHNLDY